MLVDTMDATARWQATRRLRGWERRQLRLVDGQRLLDVGCGRGEVALTLAEDLGDTGEVVGVDVSAKMVGVARAQADAARCRVRFSVGDACALDESKGLTPLARTVQTHTWTSWNPDESAAPDGCFSMESLGDDLVAVDQLAPAERADFVSTIRTAALHDQFSMRLTMFAVVAAAPAVEHERPRGEAN